MPPKDTDNKEKRLKTKRKRQEQSSDDDSSVDEHGNIRDLIDYDYEESSEENELVYEEMKPLAAAIAAKHKLRKIFKMTPDSNKESAPRMEIMDMDSGEESDIVKPKRRIQVAAEHQKQKITDMEMSTDDDDSDYERKKSKKEKKREKKEKKREKKRAKREDDDTSSEEDEYDEDDEEYEEEEEEEEEEQEQQQPGRRKNTFDIIISDMLGSGSDPNKPKKYNMKKEPENVKRFVELVQKEDEGEEDTIDNDITYFKSLTKEKQAALLRALEVKASPAEVQVPLKFKIL